MSSPWFHTAGEHRSSLTVADYAPVDTQADEQPREAHMTYDARDIAIPRPRIGAPVLLGETLGIVTYHPRAYPRMVVVTTEADLQPTATPGRLADPGNLLDPGPEHAWDVHVLQALMAANPVNRITP